MTADEQLENNMKKFLDKEVIVIGKTHPHYNEKGKTIRVEKVDGKPAMIVLNDAGVEFPVHKGNDLFFIVAKIYE